MLTTSLWASALIRRAELSGAFAAVVQKGDAERGDIVVKVATLDGRARLYSKTRLLSGDVGFIDLSVQGVGPDEGDVDAYCQRLLARDPDLWIIEIEDRAGRHFLTETVEMGNKPVDPN